MGSEHDRFDTPSGPPSSSPWGARAPSPTPDGGDGQDRERIFNAPLAPLLVALSMPVMFFLQERLPDEGLRWAFFPNSLTNGGWWPGILTSMILHGGWAHALMNAGFAIAFAPPIARLFSGAKGGFIFFAYYIVCGLAGTLGYGLIHLGSDAPMVGASGAVTGLLGGAIRLLGTSGRVRPLSDRGVISTSAVILILNAVTGLIGFAPGADGAGIAWEAHAFGFLAGLLLIGPLARWFGKPPAGFASEAGLGDPRA
ncbi:rhomboid family intramembrane serine protease [Brevundimonas goettingensis]|uniref:Rhomboid family intramembrane serine protease n=1 Tax=Brevundimonas goettingensis TaxID=2774190 RepID=A0A975C123_9CAUL|nr:rhomboid family intramembrane serine protease [Brevundimonas goettingensis]QTC91923.1 rhomboid family intramembrane serine protease [Brevundimonas goettingensis]